MIVVFTIIGLITGCFIGYQIGKPKKVVKDKYSRRGLYKSEYSVSIAGVNNGDVQVVFEVGELESTDTLSKIEVISVKTNRSEYNTSQHEQKKMKTMIDQSWIDSNSIQWITTLAEIRNNKIDEIFG